MSQFDLLDPQYLLNPYEGNRRLRGETPIYHSRDLDVWVVSTYREVRAILTDEVHFSSRLGLGSGWVLRDARPPEKLMNFQAGLPGVRVLLGSDDPEHAALRQIMAPRLSRTVSRGRLPALRAEAARLLREAASAPETDLVTQLAEPFTSLAIAEIIGFPPAVAREISNWVNAATSAWDPLNPLSHGQSYRRLARAGWQMLRTLIPVLRERDDNPVNEGMIDDLILAQREGRLTEMDVLSNIVLLVMAGSHTTKCALTSALALLAQDADLLHRLRTVPRDIPGFVEEVLRLYAPVRMTWRGVRSEVSISDCTLPEGAHVGLMIGSACRDDGVFARPDELLIGGSDRPASLAFGAGGHYCIGAHLARVQVNAVIESFVNVIRDVTLVEPVQPMRNLIVEGVASIPARIRMRV